MSNSTFAGAAVLLLVGLGADPARAQVVGRGGGPVGTPTVSPYLNLLRNNNTPGLNYFGLVRPQIQTNADLRLLNQQTLQPRAGLPSAGDNPEEQLATGHAAVFMNLGGYFQNLGGGAGVSRPTLGTAVRSNSGSGSSGSMRLPRPRSR